MVCNVERVEQNPHDQSTLEFKLCRAAVLCGNKIDEINHVFASYDASKKKKKKKEKKKKETIIDSKL